MWLLPVLSASLAAAPLDAQRLAQLFGFGRRVAAQARPASDEPPQPPRLLGTLLGTHTPSLVSLEYAGTVRTVRVGDVVGGWTLVRIESPWCVTIHDRRGETHLCARAQPSSGSTVADRSAAGSPKTVTLSRGELERRVREEAERVLRNTHVVPAFREGQLAGLTLHFPPDSPLRALGLEPKDTIERVDGRTLTPAEAARLWSRWTELRGVSLTVQRGGARHELRLSVD